MLREQRAALDASFLKATGYGRYVALTDLLYRGVALDYTSFNHVVTRMKRGHGSFFCDTPQLDDGTESGIIPLI